MNSLVNKITHNLRLILPKYKPQAIRRCSTITVSEEQHRQSTLFSLEQKRQRESIGRIEKIEVNYESPTKTVTLVMNKNLSTPYECAQHISETVVNRSAVALVNGNTWHMHKPLPESCTLQFLHYNIQQPAAVNKAFWKTCSFLLGAVVNDAFKNNINVQLHSFPTPNVRSGSFIYDVELELDDWVPTHNELRVLSIEMVKFCRNEHNLESLDVNADFALTLFKNNPHKTAQIPDIAAKNAGRITLFRAGHHIDISKGPMVTNTNHIGRVTVTNVIKLNTKIGDGSFYRFQGVALPQSIVLNHYAYGILEERAKKMNPAKIPGVVDENSFVKQMMI